MKNAKKIIALVMAMTMLLALLAGCGSNNQNSGNTGSNTNNTNNTQETPDGADKEQEPADDAEAGGIAYGGTFVYPISEDVANFMPYLATGTVSGETVCRAMFDPLFVIDKDEIRYYLAESLTVSDDSMSYQLKLRDGLTWSDGDSITVDDLLFYLSLRDTYSKINGEPITFEKVDDLTLNIVLPVVSASYISSFGKILLCPSHLYEGLDYEAVKVSPNNELGVGSGAYVLEKWNKGESIVLSKREDYYRGEPTFDQVIFKVLGDNSAQELAYQTGDLTIKKIANELELENYRATEGSEVYLFDEGRVNFVSYNINSDLMSNKDARKAVSLALNQEEIVAGAWGELAELANSIFPANSTYFDNSRQGYVQNVEEAKALAESSGLTSRPIKIIYDSTYTGLEEAAAIMQQQLAAIGVTCEIQGYDTSGYNQIYFFATDGDWDIGLKNYSGSGDNNSINYMFKQGGSLTKNFLVTDEAEALWQAGNTTLDTAERAEIYAKLDDQLDEDYCMYRLCYPKAAIVAHDNVEGIDAIDLSPLFEDWLMVHFVNK